jgi:hypothetical protein
VNFGTNPPISIGAHAPASQVLLVTSNVTWCPDIASSGAVDDDDEQAAEKATPIQQDRNLVMTRRVVDREPIDVSAITPEAGHVNRLRRLPRGRRQARLCLRDRLAGLVPELPRRIRRAPGLLDYGPRYAAVVRSARLGFTAPTRLDELHVVEQLAGNATTDFGALGVIPSCDRAGATATDFRRFDKIIRAGWRALDAARQGATDKVLSKGPRGGGRELDAIVTHVVDGDVGHLSSPGLRKSAPRPRWSDRLEEIRKEIIEALEASAHGEIPATGPRGKARWPVRYFVRRVAWHTISHAWEIERSSRRRLGSRQRGRGATSSGWALNHSAGLQIARAWRADRPH